MRKIEKRSVFCLILAALLGKGDLPLIVPLVVAMLAGLAVGMVNGIGVAIGDLPPFIMTLGSMTAVRGLALLTSNGKPITGISKGHGYQGVIKRHGASRLKETHGTGPVHRHAGSMGSGTDPARIFKGKIGAGQMGNEQVTVLNLDVVKVDTELGLIAVRGAIPGPKGGLVTIKSTVKVHKVKQAGADISKNPQKASGRNPQKASARNK